MRIVFIGAVEFSKHMLAHLIASGADIVGVCTSEYAGINSDHADLSHMCKEAGLPWRYVSAVNSAETMDWIRTCRPDVIFCFGWSRLLGRGLLELPRLGVVGYHPSALPANRGRHPLIWALVLGLKRTASTFFFMDEGADSGDIISQREVAIERGDDAGTLYEKVVVVAIEQLSEFVPRLADGSYPRVKQDHAQSTVWRKRSASDGRIDWRMSANSIRNLVRALTRPYVGADFQFKGQSFKVWKAVVVDVGSTSCEPGKVLRIDNENTVIKCGDRVIRLIETEPYFAAAPGDYL
jgi:methionyl-tRNA formyltransferase